MTELPQEAAPLRPVSDDHRHEPADYELEPNELASCPFCGGSNVHPHKHFWNVVLCVDCGAEGPANRERDTEAEACKAWNQRSSLATRPAKGDVIPVGPFLEWMDKCWPKLSDSDFNQGVVRGFEIIKAQVENGHVPLTALTQAPRSCCADEREKAERHLAAITEAVEQRDWNAIIPLTRDFLMAIRSAQP